MDKIIKVYLPDEFKFSFRKIGDGLYKLDFWERYSENVPIEALKNTATIAQVLKYINIEVKSGYNPNDRSVWFSITVDEERKQNAIDALVGELLVRTSIGSLTLKELLALAVLGGGVVMSQRNKAEGKK